MALITDPDSLSQGTETVVSDADFGAPSGETVTITSTANLPAMSSGDYFEVRDMSVAAFNGLYVETGGSPTTSSVTADKLSGSPITGLGDPGSESCSLFGVTGGLKNVMFDVNDKEVWLLEKGALSTDGVTMLALHSFMKIAWKSDDFLVAGAGFPMVGISFAAGQWQIGVDPSGNNNGWKFATDITSPVTVKTRRLVRNAGWDEIDSAGNTIKKYFNVTTLGTFEDTLDNAHYRFGNDPLVNDAVDFEFTDAVNEPVLYFDEIGNPTTWTLVDGGGGEDTATQAAGDFVADGFKVGGQVTIRASNTPANDGTYTLTAVAATTLTVATGSWDTAEADTFAQVAVDNDNSFDCYIRIRDADPEGKTYDKADLTSAGETAVTSKIIKFPLANATDLDITETDANVSTISPYTEVRLRYLAGTYNREVDTSTKRNFGIVVDVGTYSQSNGASATSTTFTSADWNAGAGETLADYNSGTLIIHEGTDQGSHAFTGDPTAPGGTLTIVLDSALTDTESDLSFTVERSAPLTADKNEIYEKVQYQLRQTTDIDESTNTVIGKTADPLLEFVGPTLKAGLQAPSNPNGGGSGVIIEGFDANNTNDMEFYDNGVVQRTFPFVAAGTLVFNQGLVDDTDGEYWLFFKYTTRTTNSDIDVTAPSGAGYTLTGTLPNMAVNDYIQISGFAETENNGLFQIDVENTPSASYDIRKVDGSDVGGVETDQTVNVDENPYPSPDAIIVDDNSVADIVGAIGSTSIAFDFDYDNNVQGGRTASSPATVILVAAGLETAQVAVSGDLTITSSTGLTFSLTSAQERNYSNP